MSNEDEKQQGSHYNLSNPGRGSFDITKNDSTVFAKPTRALYVGSAGDVTVRMIDDDATDYRTYANVQEGTVLDIQVDMVRATGTAASGFVGIL